jgi:hypothetical protein
VHHDDVSLTKAWDTNSPVSPPHHRSSNADLSETNWRELGVHPQRHRKEAAAKGVETRRELGELKEAAAKTVETKRKSVVLKEEATKAAATRKREG